MAVFTSFDDFVSSTNGQQIGNGTYYAYINLLWEHLGSVYYTANPSDPDPTTQGVKEGWLNTDARAANTITHLSQVTSLSDVKRGDVIILSIGLTGRAGFANADYNGTTFLDVYAQNYSIPRVELNSMDVSTFIGGWRYDAWNSPVPPTPVLSSQKRFPWVLYARKLRNRML